MDIMQIAYHPEVAQSLLQIQQAQAKVDARKLIVEGAVSIVKDALTSLADKDINLSEQHKTDLVKRMMVITCSDQGEKNN